MESEAQKMVGMRGELVVVDGHSRKAVPFEVVLFVPATDSTPAWLSFRLDGLGVVMMNPGLVITNVDSPNPMMFVALSFVVENHANIMKLDGEAARKNIEGVSLVFYTFSAPSGVWVMVDTESRFRALIDG